MQFMLGKINVAFNLNIRRLYGPKVNQTLDLVHIEIRKPNGFRQSVPLDFLHSRPSLQIIYVFDQSATVFSSWKQFRLVVLKMNKIFRPRTQIETLNDL